jgi:ER membrane protein complex subunit 4
MREAFFVGSFYWRASQLKKKKKMQQQQLSDKELKRQRIQRRLTAMQFDPVRSLPMTLFMLWMVGNDISLFSIMFVGMAVTNPVTSLFGTPKVFEQFDEAIREDPSLRSTVLQAKLIYAACCIAAFVVGLVKISWMGLMPVSVSDWMDHRPPTITEFSYGGGF